MIQISELVYRIAGRTILDGASVTIPDGARVGLVGRNGTGKTTLLKLLMQELSLESGSIQMPRGARIGQVAQEAPAGEEPIISIVLAADSERASLLLEAETCRDAHRIGDIHLRLTDIDAHGAPARAARILSGLGFDEAAQQRPAKEFSGGWRMRVALAAMLFSEPDLLLLDEPTNYLDLEGVLWLESHLAKYPNTLIIVSHDRDLLNGAVDQILHMDRGKMMLWRGNYDSFERQRAEKRVLDAKAAKKQELERKHLQSFVDRFRASATKASQAQSRMKRLAKLQPIEAMMEDAVRPFHFPPPQKPLASPIIAMDGVVTGYNETPILRGLTLRIDHDDRIGLLGSNGNGKSTFAKLISQKLVAMQGQYQRSTTLSVGYFAQHQLDELGETRTPYEQIRALMPQASEASVRARTARIGFGSDKADTPAGKLSGGEKARLLLGITTFHAPHLLVLDEPTNHLDIDARAALVEAINDYQGAVILISHDRYLLDACADRLWLVKDGTVKPFEGDLEAYRRQIVDGGAGERKAEAARESGRDERREAADRRVQQAPIRAKILQSEEAINKARKRLAGIDALLSDPELYKKEPAKSIALSKLRRDCEAVIEAEETLWLQLNEQLEG